MKQCSNPITMELVKGIPTTVLWKIYMTMLKIRMVEEKIADLITRKEIICPCHLYIGQEAVATGVCTALENNDYVFSTHRSHGHYIAKGGSIKLMMAELYGRVTGCSRGRGGSMHITSPLVGLPGSSAIVAGTIPLAVGTALAFSIKKNGGVSVAFFGDGATDEGVFYESLNFAALKKLPIIFICENNLYSTHMHISARQLNGNIYKKAQIFKMPGIQIDGNNVLEVFQAASEAIEDARNGKGPTLLECMTYRWRGHVGPNWDIDKGLRSKEEVEWWVDNCPLKRLEEFLLKENILSESKKKQISKQVNEEIEEAIEFAKESPFPDKSEVLNDVFKS